MRVIFKTAGNEEHIDAPELCTVRQFAEEILPSHFGSGGWENMTYYDQSNNQNMKLGIDDQISRQMLGVKSKNESA